MLNLEHGIQILDSSSSLELEEMRKAFFVGAFIIIAYGVMVDSITQSKIAVMIADTLSGLAVIGIAFLMYPLFKEISNSISISYIALKTIEGTLMILAGILYLSTDSTFTMFRDWIYNGIHLYVFAVSALLFYYLLYRSKIIPQYISKWGAISILLLFMINMLSRQGDLSMPVMVIGYAPIVLNEFFLAFWLMIKGFRQDKFYIS